MSSNQSLDLQDHLHSASREEEVDEDHAVRSQLGRDSDEVKIRLHPALILGDCVAHGQDQSVEEKHKGQANDGIDGLQLGQSMPPTITDDTKSVRR